MIGLAVVGAPPRSSASSTKPNIVVIMSDDQRWDTLAARYMPNLNKHLIPNGVLFKNAFVSDPLCCPSRVTTLTGKYSYTTGVYGNRGTWGGYDASVRYGAMNDTIATDLHDDGYRTALIGKYLNGYSPHGDYLTKPSGWDRWFAISTGRYYRYWAAVDGVKRRYFGSQAQDYATRVLQVRALLFIDRNKATGRPFFLYFATTAPHAPAIPDPRDVGRFDSDVESYNYPPSVGEADVSDKPQYIRSRTWTHTIQRGYDAFHARQLTATYGVDRAIGQIWQALPENTVVLYMSDNGFLWGEHRWSGKQVPYNESLRIPMLIAGKGVDLSTIGVDGGTSNRLALNVDIRATLESFVTDLTQHPSTDGEPWTGPTTRQDFPIMHWEQSSAVPVYCGIRSADWMYVKYSGGFEEAYDERADRWEQDNLFVTDPSNPELPALRAAAAAECSQQQGRIYPDGWPF